MINWINSWNAGNKKEVYELVFRLGTITVFQMEFCPCFKCEKKKCARFRFMLLNFGFEIQNMSFSRKFCDKSPFKQKDEDPNTFKLGLNELGESPVRNRNKYFLFQ